MSEKINSDLQDNLVVSGSLDSTTVPHLIVLLGKGKKTGKLKVSSFHELSIYFDQGVPFYAAGGGEDTKIGKILLNRGKITEYQFNKVIEEIKNDPNKRIGELLVSMGIISPHELNEYLELQIKEKILNSFLYTDGEYEFSSFEEPPKQIYYCKINSGELIYEGFKRYIDGSAIDFSNFDFEVSHDINTEASSLGLGPKELRVVQLISNEKSIQQIEQSGVMSKEEILRLVLLLNLYYLLRIEKISVIDYLRKSFNIEAQEVLKSESEFIDVDGNTLNDERPEENVLTLDDEYLDENEELNEEEIVEQLEEVEISIEDAGDEEELIEFDSDNEQVEDNSSEVVLETDLKNSTAGISSSEQEIYHESSEELDPTEVIDINENLTTPLEVEDSDDAETIEQIVLDESTEESINIPTSNDSEETTPLEVEDFDDAETIEQIVLDESTEETIDIPSANDSEEITNTGKFVIDNDFFDKLDSTLNSKSELKETEDLDDISESDSKSDENLNIDEEPPLQNEANRQDSEFEDIKEFFEYIVKEEDYYKILDVKDDSTSDEIRASYFKLIKQFHPDANPDFPDDIKAKAEQIFTKVTNAYEILYDEEKRKEYELSSELDDIKNRANSIYEAEVVYNEGELYLRQRNYEQAEKSFSRAIELNPDESAYLGIYAWTKFLASTDKTSIAEEIRKQLENAISIDEGIAENYYYLGSVFKYIDNNYKAKANFEKAVELDRNYIEAKRELRLLENRKNQKKEKKSKQGKGNSKFWSSLFKK